MSFRKVTTMRSNNQRDMRPEAGRLIRSHGPHPVTRQRKSVEVSRQPRFQLSFEGDSTYLILSIYCRPGIVYTLYPLLLAIRDFACPILQMRKQKLREVE